LTGSKKLLELGGKKITIKLGAVVDFEIRNGWAPFIT
jgi:hypothetical protein